MTTNATCKCGHWLKDHDPEMEWCRRCSCATVQPSEKAATNGR